MLTDQDRFVAINLHSENVGRTSFGINFFASIIGCDGTTHHTHNLVKNFESETIYGWKNFISFKELFDEESKIIDDGNLTLLIHLELIEDADASLLPEVGTKPMEKYETLINNEDVSDFTFVFKNGVTIAAHSGIIAAMYPEFGARIKSEIKDKKLNVINIDAETLSELLRFVYTGRINNLDRTSLSLMEAANKYGIVELKTICSSSLMGNLTEANVKRVLELADANDDASLKANCINFIKW